MSELLCRRLIAVAVAALLPLGAVACGSDDDISSQDQTTTIESTNDGGTVDDADEGPVDAGEDGGSDEAGEEGVDGDVGAPVSLEISGSDVGTIVVE